MLSINKIVSPSNVTLWNPRSGALENTLRGHTRDVKAVAYSPCGQWITSGSGDNTIRLWDTHSRMLKRVVIGHINSVSSVAFSSQGLELASGCVGEEIWIWNVAAGESMMVLRSYYNMQTVVYLPGTCQLASTLGKTDIVLWNKQDKGFRYILKQDLAMDHFAFSFCGRWMATTHGLLVRLWRYAPNKEAQDQSCAATAVVLKDISSVAWRPDGLEFVTVCSYGSTRVWKVVEEAGGVSIQMVWGSGGIVLAASSAIAVDAVGISEANRTLLQGLGAIGAVVSSNEDA